jgi:hypothetical protein
LRQILTYYEFTNLERENMNLSRISKNDARYPPALGHYLGVSAPEEITARGNLEILNDKKTALFCSAPPNVPAILSSKHPTWRRSGAMTGSQ